MKVLRHYFLLVLFFMSFSSFAIELPKGYEVKVNEAGESYVVNRDDTTMIEPNILQIGSNNKFIIACIKNISIDTEEKRFMFINLKWGGATDSVNKKNWEYFKSVYPSMSEIKLEKLSEESCP